MDVDREGPERPRYGKDMHPSNQNFSEQNTMTSSNFYSRQIPLQRAEDDGRVPTSASGSVASSYASQAPESPPLAELNARTWDQTRRFQPRRDQLRPAAPLSEASSSSSGLPVPQYPERLFRVLDSPCASPQVEARSESLSDSDTHTVRNQPIHDPRGYSPSPSSYGNVSTASSEGYSHISTGSLSPRSREYMSPPSPVPPGPNDRRGRKRNRPGYEPSARSSSARSTNHSHRARESRESGHSRQHPPRSSETRTQRQGRRAERSRSRESRGAEARPSRSEYYDDTVASEDYAARDYRAGSSRTPHPPSERHSSQTGRVDFPGDSSQFSPSYLQEMGNLRFGATRNYDAREDEGRYAEEEYDSDDHQFTPEYLRDMARIRHWERGQRH